MFADAKYFAHMYPESFKVPTLHSLKVGANVKVYHDGQSVWVTVKRIVYRTIHAELNDKIITFDKRNICDVRKC
jgi:hypothetical protein